MEHSLNSTTVHRIRNGLLGHLGPGTLIFLWGMWWIVAPLRLYFFKYGRVGKSYQSRASYPCPTYPKISLEGYLMLILSIFVFVVEGYYSYVANAGPSMDNIIHCIVGSVFFAQAWFDIFLVAKRRNWASSNWSYVPLTISVSLSAALFTYHLFTNLKTVISTKSRIIHADNEDKSPSEINVHLFLSLSIDLVLVAIVCEIWKRKSIVASLCRGTAMSLVGTWFLQISFMFPNPLFQWNVTFNGCIRVFAFHFIASVTRTTLCYLGLKYYVNAKYMKLKNASSEEVENFLA